MRLWQKRSRLCHFLELRSGMRIDSLGCTWWVLSSKWSKSSQLAVATESLVPLIQRGLSVIGRCSSWAVCSRDGAFSRLLCLHKTLRVIVDDRQPLRAISGGPTPALRHQRRTWFGASYQQRTWLRKRSSTDNGRSRRLPRRRAGLSSHGLTATWRALLLRWASTRRSSTGSHRS